MIIVEFYFLSSQRYLNLILKKLFLGEFLCILTVLTLKLGVLIRRGIKRVRYHWTSLKPLFIVYRNLESNQHILAVRKSWVNKKLINHFEITKINIFWLWWLLTANLGLFWKNFILHFCKNVGKYESCAWAEIDNMIKEWDKIYKWRFTSLWGASWQNPDIWWVCWDSFFPKYIFWEKVHFCCVFSPNGRPRCHMRTNYSWPFCYFHPSRSTLSSIRGSYVNFLFIYGSVCYVLHMSALFWRVLSIIYYLQWRRKNCWVYLSRCMNCMKWEPVLRWYAWIYFVIL